LIILNRFLEKHCKRMGKLIMLVFVVIFWSSSGLTAQNYYWIGFTNKANSPWSLQNPEAYLSQRAIERRESQSISVDSLDLPVNTSYVAGVLQLGATLVHASKWMNGITVKASAADFETVAGQLPFVKEVQLTKRSFATKSVKNKFIEPEAPGRFFDIDINLYGASAAQVSQLNTHAFHKQGHRGEGIHIAVLDAGFYKADELQAFDSLWAGGQILGTRDFAGGSNVFQEHYHGMSVLSIMGGNIPGQLIGTAPKASYWLIRSEDVFSEFLIEEDNWVVAAEFADSVGADIINSSLGYFLFDDPEMNHTYADMDGNTTRVTRAANIAATRGMLVFSSAGNEGRNINAWRHIIAPSDGHYVIGVGAVNGEGIPAPFTSHGPASDGSVKPNVAAVGWNTIIQRQNGTIGPGNGTSFSSPVMAGAAACLWQANPQATSMEIKNAIEQSAHLYQHPDTLMGYGIPDLKLAERIITSNTPVIWDSKSVWLAYPNPANDYIILQKSSSMSFDRIILSFYTTDGKLLWQEKRNDAAKIVVQNLQSLPQGLLLLQIISGSVAETVKIRRSP
jgi:serine protease AprX